jgi:hypothetical protein
MTSQPEHAYSKEMGPAETSPAETWPAAWTRCSPWLEAALPHGGGFYTLDDVRSMVERGEAQFWPGRRSAIVTQFWIFPRHKALHYWLVGGDLREILDEMQPCLEAFARATGCTDIISAGRAGWTRALKPHGHHYVWTALRKTL